MTSDEELLEQAKKGDAEAFETLYRRHRDWVYRLAWRFTGNEADALDVLQETFAYLLRKLPGLRLTAAMTTFLYPVVKHLSLNLRRKRTPGRRPMRKILRRHPRPGRRGDLPQRNWPRPWRRCPPTSGRSSSCGSSTT